MCQLYVYHQSNSSLLHVRVGPPSQDKTSSDGDINISNLLYTRCPSCNVISMPFSMFLQSHPH